MQEESVGALGTDITRSQSRARQVSFRRTSIIVCKLQYSNVRTHTHIHTQLHAITTKRRSPTRATKDHLLTTGATKDHLITAGAHRAVGLAFTQAVHDARVFCPFIIDLSVRAPCMHARMHKGIQAYTHKCIQVENSLARTPLPQGKMLSPTKRNKNKCSFLSCPSPLLFVSDCTIIG